jgi:hypothetical protein
MNEWYREGMRLIEHLHGPQWTAIVVVAAAIGLFCMRGFGSRAGY